jgi:hypothetical protein
MISIRYPGKPTCVFQIFSSLLKLRIMKKNLLFIALLTIQLCVNGQTITSAQTGAWDQTSTWVGGVVPGPANDVVLAATHTVTFNVSTVTVNSLTINSGGTFIINASTTFRVTQNVSNSGTINNNSAGGIRMNGSLNNSGTITGAVNSLLGVGGSQLLNNGSIQSSFLYFATDALGISSIAASVDGTGSFTIANILVQKSATGNVTINVPLTLSSAVNLGGGGGKIIIENNDFGFSSVSAGNATIYIVTNGTGRLIYNGGGSPKTVPIGTATSFSPVVFSNGNISTHSFAVRVSNSFTATPPGTAVVNREWSIDDMTGGANVDVSFQWTGAIENAGFNRALSAIARYNGTDWQAITSYAAATGTNPYTRVATGVINFSKFLIGSSGSFPIITAQSGNWNTTTTWQAGIIPSASTDNVIIASGHTVTYDLASATINSLSINNTGALQLNAGNILTANSNLSNAGAIILNSNSSLRIGGDLTNSSTIFPAGGAVNTLLSVAGNLNNSAGQITSESFYFSSTSLGSNTNAQAINSNNSLLNFTNVFLFNNGVNITFNVPLSFSTLTFNGTTGHLILQNSGLTINSSISGTGELKYIQTNGASSFLRINGSASPKFFPVGTNTSYTPLTISNGNIATHNFSVRTSNTFTNTPNNNAVVNREWNITDNTGGANVDLTFQWNASDEDPTFDRTVSYVGHHNGVEWRPVSSIGPASGSNPYTKTATGVTSFSPFGVGSSGALPVHLFYFAAEKENNHIKLEWKTENEINFSRFEIEKSTDGSDYNRIKTVPAINNPGTSNYSAIDESAQGNIYYRLKMIDVDGSFTYSKVVRINPGKKYTVIIYPNPASDKIFVQNMNKYNTGQIADVAGKIVQQFAILQGDEQVTINQLKNGIYYLRLISKEDVQTVRFIKE